MVQGQSQEYRPEIPSGVKVIAWMVLVFAPLSLVVFEVLALRSPRGEVMFRYLGHDYLVAGMLSIALGVALVFVMHGLVIASAIFVLKGRMWAYYMFLAASALAVVSIIVDLLARRWVGLMAWPQFVVLWVLIRDYQHYRDFARSRTAQHT